MSKVLKALFSPGKLIVVTALVVAVGVSTGHILPKAQAVDCDVVEGLCPIEQIECPQNMVIQDNECVDPDVCPNIDDTQTQVPSGYHFNDKTGECDQDSTPQVLGESTTVNDPAPQVLAETFGK